MYSPLPDFWNMEFPSRLARLRKERNLTQQQLADLANMHVVQVNRYEGGVSQPTIDALKRLAVALNVTTDSLLFDESERGPDEELRLQFEALSSMPQDEKQLAKALLEALILKHQVAGAIAGTQARMASLEAEPLASIDTKSEKIGKKAAKKTATKLKEREAQD